MKSNIGRVTVRDRSRLGVVAAAHPAPALLGGHVDEVQAHGEAGRLCLLRDALALVGALEAEIEDRGDASFAGLYRRLDDQGFRSGRGARRSTASRASAAGPARTAAPSSRRSRSAGRRTPAPAAAHGWSCRRRSSRTPDGRSRARSGQVTRQAGGQAAQQVGQGGDLLLAPAIRNRLSDIRSSVVRESLTSVAPLGSARHRRAARRADRTWRPTMPSFSSGGSCASRSRR